MMSNAFLNIEWDNWMIGETMEVKLSLRSDAETPE